MSFPPYWLWIFIVLGLAPFANAEGRMQTAEGGNLSGVNGGQAVPAAERLVKFYTPPQGPGESNHYLDMWGGPPLREVALAAGLTNNHALLVNSHGKTMQTPEGRAYVFYPHSSQVSEDQRSLCFSAADLAAVLGPRAASEIRNIVLSGCNREGGFSAAGLRKYFVNATNIVHAPAGQSGYQPMFFQALFNLSAEVRPLYQTSRSNERGGVEYSVEYTPESGSVLLSPYVAELFEPGKAEPYKVRIAGRELLGGE